jgi:hypothetical protein
MTSQLKDLQLPIMLQPLATLLQFVLSDANHSFSSHRSTMLDSYEEP